MELCVQVFVAALCLDVKQRKEAEEEEAGEKPLSWFMVGNRLVGLVVKASASRAGGPGFESR